MARADLVIDLVRAGAQGDQLGFRRTVEAIVAEERQRQHHVVADRLQEFLHTNARGNEATVPPEVGSLVHEVHPRRLLGDLMLPPAVTDACTEMFEEQRRVDVLRAHALEPRHRVLLSGPPGNGKTSLAEAIAGELAVPMLVVRYDAVIGSFLGETAARLARMFDYVRTRRCVVFFDEFDTLGKERGDEHETGEVKRIVSSLLLNIDALPSHAVVVTATNHPELLDRAVWRRFQLRLSLPPPTGPDITRCLTAFEQRRDVKLSGPVKKSIRAVLKGRSFSEIEEFLLDVQRRLVLGGEAGDVETIVRTRLKQWRSRCDLPER